MHSSLACATLLLFLVSQPAARYQGQKLVRTFNTQIYPGLLPKKRVLGKGRLLRAALPPTEDWKEK